ncbi:hypothetical protein U3516DRAFT_525917, partial [Neocallimastix sp. 'constans']
LFLFFLVYPKKPKKERDYLIFINGPEELNEMDDPKAKEFFEPIEDEIYSLIQQNKDTYDDPSELDKIEKECEANRNNKTIYQYRYCSVHAFYLIKGKLIIYARLLTPEIVEKIKLIPNVTEVTIN